MESTKHNVSVLNQTTIKVPLPKSSAANTPKKATGKRPIRTHAKKFILPILISFVLIGTLVFSIFIQDNHTSVKLTAGNAGIAAAIPTNTNDNTISKQQSDNSHANKVMLTENNDTVKPESTVPKDEKPVFFSNDIIFDQAYTTPENTMPYALYTPSSVNPKEPTALLIWLHGSGERNVDSDTFMSRGLPDILNNWKLSGFNAYILCPHLTNQYDDTWNTEKSKVNLQNLLDYIIGNYNIDINNIAIAGHSLGGQGVLYMAHELPNYFSKAVVLSGYDPNIEESEITLPLISYIGTYDKGEDNDSIRYAMTTLATTFGDNNIMQIDSSHGELPQHVFNLDANGDNESDVIKWLFAEKASGLKGHIAPEANKTNVNAVPLFFQTDYPDIPYSQGTVATSGCGISCLAMVASYQTGIIYTPGTLAKYNDSGYDNGTRMENAATALGLHFEKSWNWPDVIKALKNGQLVIVLVGEDTIFTNGGHFIVLTGITNDGKIMINDPYEPNYKRIGNRYFTGFDESEITCDFNGAWIFDKKS